MRKIILKGSIASFAAIIALSLIVGTLVVSLFPYESEAATKPKRVAWRSVTKQPDSSTVVLNWKKAKGAVKYQIYSKRGNKSWKRIKTTRETSYVYKVKKNRSYIFKIRGINRSYKGKFSKVKKAAIGNVYRDPTIGYSWVVEPIKGDGLVNKIKVTDSTEGHIMGITSDGLEYFFVVMGSTPETGRIYIGDESTSKYKIEQASGAVDYNVKLKSTKYKIYWSCDGIEPVLGQEEVVKKLPMYRFARPVRGTVTSADGTVKLPKIRSYEYIEEYYYEPYTQYIWIKVYKGNKRVCEIYEKVNQ